MNEREIFLGALRTSEGEPRREYLEQVCGDDRKLRDRIVRLLRSSEVAGSFLELPASALVRAASPPGEMLPSRAADSAPQSQLESGVLGDYRILREIGRGGMGVVYEAEQISLGRHVALKVLPLASMLDKTQLARFQNEARAAASLDHPNVVHVHSVGHERGVHYYAMQLIDGQTVAEAIAAERRRQGLDDQPCAASPTPAANDSGPDDTTEAHVPPGPAPTGQAQALQDTGRSHRPASTTKNGDEEKDRMRRVVEVAIQAADALEHAHRMGIVHRDVKPSNLLIDAEQHLWVADFGLALVEAEGSITASGGMLGTLRYMSPEQMRGDRHVLDHHADIYSLGATLYEMLTLRPAFPDRDASLLMQRILNDEPTAPRQINRTIPRDLETIVLKAMARDHEDRFATARDMAADLQRFLDDEPILARPPGPFERAKKWANRHRAMVATAAVTLVVAVLVASLLLWNERSETLAALERETTQRRLAEEQQALTAAAQKESDRNLSAALDAVDKLLQHVSNPNLQEAPQIQPVRQEILQDVLDFYREFSVQTGESKHLRHQAAVIWRGLAKLASELGDVDTAQSSYSHAMTQFELLSDESPQAWTYQDEFLYTALTYGWFHHHAGDRQESRKSFERAESRAEHLRRHPPQQWSAEDQRELANRHLQAQLGLAAHAKAAGDDDTYRTRILAAYRQAGDLDSIPPETAASLEQKIAQIHTATDPSLADQHFRSAVAKSRGWVDETPTRHSRSWHTQNLLIASRFFEKRDSPLAKQYVCEAFEISARLVSDFPDMSICQRLYSGAVEARLRLVERDEKEKQQLVEEYLQTADRWSPEPSTCVSIGRLLRELARPEQAMEQFDRALQLDPGNYLAHYCRANVYWDLGRYTNAIAGYTKALELNPRHYWGWTDRGKVFMHHLERYEEALADFDRAIELQPLAHFYQTRAEAHFRLKQLDKGMADLNMALERDPSRSSISPDLNGIAWNLVTLGNSASDHSDVAVRLAEEAIELAPENGSYWNTLGVAQYRDGQWTAALESLNKSMEMSSSNGFNWFFKSMALWQLDQREEARRVYETAVSWMDENRPDGAGLQRCRGEAAKLLQIEGE